MEDASWTETDLALLQSLDKAGTPLAMIARRLGRDEAALAAKLPEARARPQTLPTPALREENDWNGPDEEGDVVPPSAGAEDPAAWVHSTPRRED